MFDVVCMFQIQEDQHISDPFRLQAHHSRGQGLCECIFITGNVLCVDLHRVMGIYSMLEYLLVVWVLHRQNFFTELSWKQFLDINREKIGSRGQSEKILIKVYLGGRSVRVGSL